MSDTTTEETTMTKTLTAKRMATVTIDIDDVRNLVSVAAAIHAVCENAALGVASGVVGPTFATSGPGNGWCVHFDRTDYASRALQGGALKYIDAASGRVMTSDPVDEDDDDGEDDTILIDLGGGRYRESDWSDESEVYVKCPDIADALEHPEAAAMMAEAVIAYHHALSDVKEWRELIRKIFDAAAAFEGIDPDDLPAD